MSAWYEPGDGTTDGYIAELKAEIERLRDIERLYKAGTEHWNPVYQVVLKERDELRAEIERLRAAATRDAARIGALEYTLNQIADFATDADEAEIMARRALAEKG